MPLPCVHGTTWQHLRRPARRLGEGTPDWTLGGPPCAMERVALLPGKRLSRRHRHAGKDEVMVTVSDGGWGIANNDDSATA